MRYYAVLFAKKTDQGPFIGVSRAEAGSPEEANRIICETSPVAINFPVTVFILKREELMALMNAAGEVLIPELSELGLAELRKVSERPAAA